MVVVAVVVVMEYTTSRDEYKIKIWFKMWTRGGERHRRKSCVHNFASFWGDLSWIYKMMKTPFLPFGPDINVQIGRQISKINGKDGTKNEINNLPATPFRSPVPSTLILLASAITLFMRNWIKMKMQIRRTWSPHVMNPATELRK